MVRVLSSILVGAHQSIDHVGSSRNRQLQQQRTLRTYCKVHQQCHNLALVHLLQPRVCFFASRASRPTAARARLGARRLAFRRARVSLPSVINDERVALVACARVGRLCVVCGRHGWRLTQEKCVSGSRRKLATRSPQTTAPIARTARTHFSQRTLLLSAGGHRRRRTSPLISAHRRRHGVSQPHSLTDTVNSTCPWPSCSPSPSPSWWRRLRPPKMRPSPTFSTSPPIRYSPSSKKHPPSLQ